MVRALHDGSIATRGLTKHRACNWKLIEQRLYELCKPMDRACLANRKQPGPAQDHVPSSSRQGSTATLTYVLGETARQQSHVVVVRVPKQGRTGIGRIRYVLHRQRATILA